MACGQELRKNIFLFIQCFALRINLILSEAVTKIDQCKLFFMTLDGLSMFFSKSTKWIYVLNNEMGMRKFLKTSATHWNYSSRLVKTVCEYKECFLSVFAKISRMKMNTIFNLTLILIIVNLIWVIILGFFFLKKKKQWKLCLPACTLERLNKWPVE